MRREGQREEEEGGGNEGRGLLELGALQNSSHLPTLQPEPASLLGALGTSSQQSVPLNGVCNSLLWICTGHFVSFPVHQFQAVICCAELVVH